MAIGRPDLGFDPVPPRQLSEEEFEHHLRKIAEAKEAAKAASPAVEPVRLDDKPLPRPYALPEDEDYGWKNERMDN